MDVVFTHCAGLDVHKKSVMACRITPDPAGQQTEELVEVREFGTLTVDLLALSDWLAAAGITHVAMESTGEYWKSVFNLLEGTVQVVLVNASQVKRVPGRKTDKADARWLAKLMRYGLLQASFIPPAGQRDLRDVTRYRTKLVQERSREINRVQGVLERANIKLASVATDIMGVSSRAILAALVEGRADPTTMAELAKRRLAIALLETIPGVDRRGAERWVAKTGIDMDRFGTAARLAAWVGVAPGNDQSAGKQRSGRTRHGNQPLRTILTQLAHAAAHTKGTYLSALYHRLAARRGRNAPSWPWRTRWWSVRLTCLSGRNRTMN